MIGCPRTGPRHPIEGWCPQCPRVTMYRRIKAYERRRGYVYPGGHIMEEDCRIYDDRPVMCRRYPIKPCTYEHCTKGC